MKRVLSFVIVAAMLLSLFTVGAFAQEPEAPAPTTGPAQEAGMYGGARFGIYNPVSDLNSYVVNYNYRKNKLEVNNEAVTGMTYDLETNTCTITNVSEPDNELFIWYMGNDFQLNVVGTCEFGIIRVVNGIGFYNTSLNIRGSGTLTVNQKLKNETAIVMFSEGKQSVMQLDIADSTTVNLYSQENKEEEGEEYAPVVGLSETLLSPEMGGAITVGGKAAPEAKHQQIKEQRSDTVRVVTAEDINEDVDRGMRVTRKDDPDGVYAAGRMDGAINVMHYIYVEALDMWMADSSFAEGAYNFRSYTDEQFAAEYDYVYGMAPTQIYFTDEWNESTRGFEAFKLQKNGESDTVYAGKGYWSDYDYSHDPDGYTIYRVTWNDKEEIYIVDPSFNPFSVSADALEQKGFTPMEETNYEQLELSVWSAPASEGGNRWESTRKVLKRKSEPDALFVEIGTYSGSGSETGITLHRVHYDPVNEEHYILYDSYTAPEYYSESDEALESGTGDFYYAYDDVTQPVKIRYVDEYFDFDEYGYVGVQVENKSHPGDVYVDYTTHHYIGSGNYVDEHTLYRLVKNEKKNRWFTDTEFEEIEFDDFSTLEQMGYSVVKSEQPLSYTTKGRVFLNEYPVYTDNNGKKYYVDYLENVFSYSENNTVTLSDGKYYIGTLMPELNKDTLNSTAKEVLTDNYSYWISGPEYHHAGGAQPQSFKLSGKLTSYLSESDYVYIKLLSNDNWEINSMVGGGETSYEIPVPAGTYKMTVSKKNHVTREYQFTVTGDFQQDVKICPLGDINGDGNVNTVDYGMANSHARNKRTLTGYAFDCGNVIADAGTPAITTADAGRINSHARNKRSLWTQ